MRALTLRDTAFVASLGGAKPDFEGGNLSFGSIKELVEELALYKEIGPGAGGTLTINGESLSSYDYCIKEGNIVVSSFVDSDWFTSTLDVRPAIIVVDGNLTINSGQTFIPPVRKLFTVLYVTGTLTVEGIISMSLRGANHSGTGDSGGAVAAADIRIATGTFGGVVNPEIPAVGANGGAQISRSSNGKTPGNPGDNGTNGQTGGGATGAVNRAAGTATSQAGRPGTAFTGGVGSGGAYAGTGSATGLSGIADGGRGGKGASTTGASYSVTGGAGNPGGDGAGTDTPDGNPGTGGTLIIICGTLDGEGSIEAKGAATNFLTRASGGASGGGSITILYGTDNSSITPAATGGIQSGGGAETGDGGAGGDGTARKLALA